MKRVIIRLLVVAGAVSAAVLLAEIGLRVAGIAHTNFYRHDLVCGSALRPGAEGWWREEGNAYVVINSQGLRDREHRVSKPPGSYRIALVGDSYAEAMQVERGQTFWARVEEDLAGCPALAGRDIEVINFGVAGYGTAQELLTLRHKVWQYEPDLVMLAFVSGNDLRNNTRVLEGDRFRPYYQYSREGLELDDSFLLDPAFVRRTGLIGRSYAALHNQFRVMQVTRRAIARLGSEQPAIHAEADLWEPGLDDAIYLTQQEPVWQEAWALTERLILEMRDDVERSKARFLLVLVTNGIQVHPEAAVREQFETSLSAADLFYPENRLTAFGMREGVDLLALAPLMRAHAERENEYLHGFGTPAGKGHWNVAGHQLAGRLIADRICLSFMDEESAALFDSTGTLYYDAELDLEGGLTINGL